MNQPIAPIQTVEAQGFAGAPAGAVEPLYLNLVISDPEVLLAAREYAEGRPRTDFIQTALKIGVLSLRAARGVVDGDAVRKEGERLMSALTERLNGWRETMEGNVTGTLTRYFDPKQGMFTERVERLIRHDGDLAQVMRGQVQVAEQSLGKLFEQFVGDNSSLFRMLDPSGDNQLVATMQKTLDGVIQAQNLSILQQFSLDQPDSALNRFLRELGTRHGDLNEAMSRRMGDVVAEFSLDRPDSALSRLVGRVESAQKNLTSELSLDNHGSALNRLQAMLQDNHKQQLELANNLSKTLEMAVSNLNTRREEAARSTRHGGEFEADLGALLRSVAEGAGDVVQDCGNSTGVIPNCKVGDYVLTVGPEKTAAGARIVVEAKENASYDLAKTLAEADIARRNRSAGVCIFVHSEKTAAPSVPLFSRYGHDIVLRWNAESEASDCWLKAALMVATALSVRAVQHGQKDGASFQLVDKAIEGIRKQVEGFEEIVTFANTSAGATAKILKCVDLMRDNMTSRLETLCEEIVKLKHSADEA